MMSVFFPISVSITQKTAPNVKVASVTNATFIMAATNRSGGPTSSHQVEAHAKEAIQAFHLKPRATSYSLNLRLELAFWLYPFDPIGNISSPPDH
ncbi:hypothetical protein HFN86_35610 [Rhizobium laguerreae]|nr:hypothetical protein [Rhizobium laguerreae]